MNLSKVDVALIPEGVVTSTSTGPEVVVVGDAAVMDVGEFTVKLVASIDPKATAVAPVNPVPVMATDVPPAIGPEAGESPVTTGGEPTKVNLSPALTVDDPYGPTTCTSTVPADSDGEVAVISVDDTTVKLAA